MQKWNHGQPVYSSARTLNSLNRRIAFSNTADACVTCFGVGILQEINSRYFLWRWIAEFRLRRHLQEKINSKKTKNCVRRPRCQHRRQLPSRPERFKQRCGSPIDDSHSHRKCEAADRATRPHQKCKRRAEKHNNRRDERKRELLLPLHREARGIEAGLLQPVDVIAELFPVHLVRLAYLATEITGRFG